MLPDLVLIQSPGATPRTGVSGSSWPTGGRGLEPDRRSVPEENRGTSLELRCFSTTSTERACLGSNLGSRSVARGDGVVGGATGLGVSWELPKGEGGRWDLSVGTGVESGAPVVGATFWK